jgi:hypothetical protein
LSLRLTGFATFGFVLEILVVEKMLLSSGENKFGATICTLDNTILKFRHYHRSRGPTQATYIRPLEHVSEMGVTPPRDGFSFCFAFGPTPV